MCVLPRCIFTLCMLIFLTFPAIHRLPEKFTDESRVIILDPMLATGIFHFTSVKSNWHFLGSIL